MDTDGVHIERNDKGGFEQWAILEVMGHRKIAGLVTEQEIAGAGFIRIDIPGPDGKGLVATQFYSPKSIYGLTPCSEELARRVAVNHQIRPVERWELQNALPAPDEDEDHE